MIWKAILEDGTEICQYLDGVETIFEDLEQSKVVEFAIVDSVDLVVPLNLSSGSLSVPNLDLHKLQELKDGEEFKLVYDAHTQNLRFENDSITKLNELVLKDERANCIKFDQTGKLYINGLEFYIAFEINSVKHELINQPPYNNIIYSNDAITDFIGNSNNINPYKRIDKVLKHTIGYNTEHVLDNVTFQLSLSLIYDVLQRCVTLNCNITPNDNVNGNLYVIYGGNESYLPVELSKDETANLNRIITLM